MLKRYNIIRNGKKGDETVLSKLPIIDAVSSFIAENNSLFCTPGHKGGKGFEFQYSKNFIDNILKFDVTEVEGLDDLHDPEGIIKESEELLSKFYGSYKSLYLINGSTLGNLIMIFSTFNEGDKILVERNCHKSVYNAIILRKLRPVFVKNKICEKYNMPLPIDMGHLFQMIKLHQDIKGIVLTYPNYYGVCCDLEKVIEICKSANIKVLVDSAHGAHFGIHPKLPENAVKIGADMVVSSTHKTLPGLTQTAYLHMNDRIDFDKVKFYFDSLSSTSPSYIFLSSLELARYYMEKQGYEDYERLLEISEKFKKKINSIKHLHIIEKGDIANGDAYNVDETRYVINLGESYSGSSLLKYLRKNGVQAEMTDGSNIILILSPFNTENDFYRLYNALESYKSEDLEAPKWPDVHLSWDIPELKVLPCNVVNSRRKMIDFAYAAGSICAENIVPYPPGVPILMMGEMIKKKHIEIVNKFIDNGIKVTGISSTKEIAVLNDKADDTA